MDTIVTAARVHQ